MRPISFLLSFTDELYTTSDIIKSMEFKRILKKLSCFKLPIRVYRKIVFQKNRFVSVMFYSLKILLEITCIFLSILYIAIKSSRNFNINYKQHVFLFIGKYVNPHKNIYHFDYYHFGLPLIGYLETKKMIHREYYYEESSIYNVMLRTIALLQINPEIVILSSWNPYSKKLSHPSKFYIRMIKKCLKNLNINLISWDTTSNGFWRNSIIDESWVKIVVTENPTLSGLQNQSAIKSDLKIIPMPINYKALNKTKRAIRGTDVFFSGKINSYRDYRDPYIKSIKSIRHNLDLNLVNTSADLLQYEEIYSRLNDSKIGVNFSLSANQSQQLKGRVWETLLCGALLLEQENEQILEYFEPNVDFVFFSTPLELKEKILYFLSNPLELNRIALCGNKKACSLQLNNSFGYVFD